jgi:hypothetical protein
MLDLNSYRKYIIPVLGVVRLIFGLLLNQF